MARLAGGGRAVRVGERVERVEEVAAEVQAGPTTR